MSQGQLTVASCPKQSIILVLLDVVRKPIEWLTHLPVSCRNNSSHLIFVVPNLIFMSQWQLTMLHVPNKQTETISIILVLVVDMVREPIEWLVFLFVSC
jgi:hypothetical protein